MPRGRIPGPFSNWTEDKFKLAIDASPNGLVLVDDQGIILLANTQIERIFEYLREELIGQNIEILIPERYRSSLPVLRQTAPAQQALGTGSELVGLTKSGREVPIEIGLNPLRVDFRLYFMTSIVDISERKRAEKEQAKLQEQIQHGQRLESLGVLAGGIAHDFNNILVAVLGHADLGLMELPANSAVKVRLENIKNASIRASKLTKQMLAYAGKGRFTVGPVCVNTLVREMALLLEVSVSRKVVFRMELADPLPPIKGDAAQIQQVIMNLITNGSEAIGDRSGMIAINTGVVKVTREYLKDFYAFDSTAEGYFVFLEVADTGCGMTKEVQARLFDPFFSTKFTGRGLGMAAVLGIVRGHSGAIRVYSEEGRGTKIKVLFPIAGPPPEAESSHEIPQLAKLAPTNRILIIDDEEHVRGVLSLMLHKCGFELQSAVNGREGLMFFQANPADFAAVFLDMNMPGMDGSEVFREIQRIAPNAQVVVMSGYNEREATFALTGRAFAGFMHKPFEMNDVLNILEKLFKKDQESGS